MIDINLPILIAQIVTFILAATILWKIAWGPLLALLKERNQNIKNDLEAATLAKEEAKKLEADYKSSLEAIQNKASELMDRARQEGAKEKDEIIRLAQTEAERLLEKARQQLKLDKDRMIQEMRKEVSALSVEIAEKLLKDCMNKEMQDKLFSEALRQVESLRKQ
jgi:F-type H+-transporting ATPase subunit b